VKVSVIIPAHNAAATIAETLQSVVEQTSPDWEVIVVNDGSSDATGAIAREFAASDSRIRVFTQENQGEAAARNAGLARARHEWVVFLDADDWIAPAHIERITAALAADSGLDAVHCGWARVAADGTEVIDNYRPPTGDLFPVLARRAAFAVHACMVRASLVKAVGWFDTGLKKSPDWDLWQRVARAGANFGSVPEVLAYYRMAPHSASMESDQMFRDGLTVLRRGHEADPRVPNPRPEYANGLSGSTVESQEFYLLSWNAGLLIGSGKDARRLIPLVGNSSYPRLYADGIAQSMFEAATLPCCKARDGWEELWPRVHGLAESFLRALEEQSQTPDLARQAFGELKRLVLRNSSSWRCVIEDDERIANGLRETISCLEAANQSLSSAMGEMQGRFTKLSAGTTELEAAFDQSLARSAVLEGEKVEVETALDGSRQQVRELEKASTDLRDALDQSRARAGILESEKGSVEASLDESRARVRELEKESVTLRALVDQTRARVGILESEKGSVEASLDESRARVREFEKELVTLRARVDQSRVRVAVLEDEKAAAAAYLEHSRLEMQSIERHSTHLAAELVEAVRRRDVVEQERASLQTGFESSMRRVQDLELREAELIRELSDAHRKAEKAELRESELAGKLADAARGRDELERREVELVRDRADAVRRIGELELAREFMESEASELRKSNGLLDRENGYVAAELEKWRRSSGERAVLIEEIQQDAWVRLGQRLGFVKHRQIAPATQARSPVLEEETEEETRIAPVSDNDAAPNWELQVGEGSEAHLIYPREDHEMVCVGITRAKTSKDWDIQLNRPGVKVTSGGRYAVAFRGRAGRPRAIGVGFAKAHDPWSSLGLYKKVRLAPEWEAFREEFVALEDDENGRIHFDLGGKAIGVDLTEVSLECVDGPADQPGAPAMAS
jgi:glycosyltransferase involved in cell wall biosynthesis